MTTARLADALGAYVRSLRSTEAPIDRWLAGQADALTPAARRGLDLFKGKAGCVQCHVMEGTHPLFTDFIRAAVEYAQVRPRSQKDKELSVN